MQTTYLVAIIKTNNLTRVLTTYPVATSIRYMFESLLGTFWPFHHLQSKSAFLFNTQRQMPEMTPSDWNRANCSTAYLFGTLGGRICVVIKPLPYWACDHIRSRSLVSGRHARARTKMFNVTQWAPQRAVQAEVRM